MRRIKAAVGATVGVVALAGAAVGAVLVSTADAIPSATVIQVVAPDSEQSRVDLGRPGPSQGDLFIFAGPLKNNQGRTVGRIDGQCTSTSTPGPADEARWQCTTTASFDRPSGAGAEITTVGVGRILAENVNMSVTGGTLGYQNVRGYAIFDYRAADRVRIYYRLIP